MPEESGPEDRAAQQSRNGWGPIPLPTGKKAQPPAGFTGSHPMPSYADWWTYYEEAPAKWGNLGARIPENIVGVDVDAYGDKNGAATLALLGGADYPDTVVLSARFRAGYDGKSGIRFFRLPEGVTQDMLWGAHDGIEILRLGHRYAVSPGSLHPDGFTYQLFDQRTQQFVDVLPPVDTLPVLPIELARLLTVDGAPWAGEAGEGERPKDDNPICPFSTKMVNKAIGSFKNKDSRYGAMSDAVWTLVNGEDEGHHLGEALEILKLAYVGAAAKDRREAGHEPPDSEFDRNVRDAYRKVALNPTDEMFKACCYTGEAAEPLVLPEAVEESDDDEEDEPKEPTAYDKAVLQKFAELRVFEDAKERLAAFKVGDAEPLVPITLREFLAQPDEDTKYRVEDVWPSEGRVLLAAGAKAGKTTMVACNLIPSLVDGKPFLGRFDAQPLDGVVVYLNMEVGEKKMRTWLREAGVENLDAVVVLNLRGMASALTINSAKGRERIAKDLRSMGAKVVILDPLVPLLAALGLDENSNGEVAKFFSYWSETMRLGEVVDDMIVHHTGHAGERSRGASRLLDEPDAIWTLTKDAGGGTGKPDDDMWDDMSPTRFLQAYGRDVTLDPEELEFDELTRLLRLTGTSKRSAVMSKRRETKNENAVATVRQLFSDGKARTKTEITNAIKVSNGDKYAIAQYLIDAGMLYDTGNRRGTGILYLWREE
jgi:hypothetical protein